MGPNESEHSSSDEDSAWSGSEQPQARRVLHRLVLLGAILIIAALVCAATLSLESVYASGSLRASAHGAPQRLAAQEKDSLFDHQGLLPAQHRHDGNVCQDDEELFGGLCYKTCKELTNNEYPYRTSGMSCCKEHPCFLNQDVKLKFCSGYDVGGDSAGGGCPHTPGACLEDEELHLGMCYKKCSLLTSNEFPYRIAAATCCKVKGTGCLNLLLTKTSKSFDIGGGKGDGDPSTPAGAHFPLKELTEANS